VPPEKGRRRLCARCRKLIKDPDYRRGKLVFRRNVCEPCVEAVRRKVDRDLSC
jgi:hypothetical protein